MTDAFFETTLRRDQGHQRLAEAARAANKAALFAALAAAGISAVRADFDGEGDSGQIVAIAASRGETAVALTETTMLMSRPNPDASALATESCPLAEAVEALAYDCLAAAAPGWEIDDGAFGEIHFDTAAETITVQINARLMEYVCSEHTF